MLYFIFILIIQQKIQAMSFSKQDELLEKLQKCVGKLQSKQMFQSSQMQVNTQRYKPAQVYARALNRCTAKTNQFQPSRQRKSIGSYCQAAPKGTRNQYINDENNHKIDCKQNIKDHNLSLGRDYLTDRNYPIKSTNNNCSYERTTTDILKKYEPEIRTSYKESARKSNNYLQGSENIRRPLRQYELNSSVSINRENNQPKQIKQFQRRYQLQQSIYDKPNGQSTPKYEPYRKLQSAFKEQAPPRRNSISHNITYNQNKMRTAQKQEATALTRNPVYPTQEPNQARMAFKQSDHKSRQYLQLQFNSINQRPNVSIGMNSARSTSNQPGIVSNGIRNRLDYLGDETKQHKASEQVKLQNSIMRQFGSKAKPRSSYGTISSVAKRNNFMEEGSRYPQGREERQISRDRHLDFTKQRQKQNELQRQRQRERERQRDHERSRQVNLKQILDEVGSTNQDTFTKLQKISELNQRINMRIKNIIQTFQSK